MKKILLVLLLVLVVGCTSTKTAKDVVEDYLRSYQNLEYQVLVDMEQVINSDIDMSIEQKEIYREVLKKQYEDLTYEITGESYNDDNATVTVKINVYDYYEISNIASEYLKNNTSEFYDSEYTYDSSLYMDFKLNLYKNTTNKVSYNLDFDLYKEDGIWKIETITSDMLEKLHGVYNYED